jgi:hypothetical protein
MAEQTQEQQRWEQLEAAVRDAVESQQGSSSGGRRRPGAATPTQRPTILFLVLIWAVIAWIWSTKPAFLFGATPVIVRPPEVEEASLRFALYLERGRLDRHVRQTGSVPATLDAAGPVEEGVSMVRTSDGYELLGNRGGVNLRMSSAMNADSFLGESLDVLRRSGRPRR